MDATTSLLTEGVASQEAATAYILSILIATMAILILCGGLYIVGKQVALKGLQHATMQAFVLVLLVPTILALGAYGRLDGQVIAGLVGSLIGYIFGQKTSER